MRIVISPIIRVRRLKAAACYAIRQKLHEAMLAVEIII
jgi:hypothetical protein